MSAKRPAIDRAARHAGDGRDPVHRIAQAQARQGLAPAPGPSGIARALARGSGGPITITTSPLAGAGLVMGREARQIAAADLLEQFGQLAGDRRRPRLPSTAAMSPKASGRRFADFDRR